MSGRRLRENKICEREWRVTRGEKREGEREREREGGRGREREREQRGARERERIDHDLVGL